MRKFIRAVGRLLTLFGFNRLKVEKIAAEAGHDSSLINRYFGSLPELQRS
jgi:AcrR family transcriptional regulator